MSKELVCLDCGKPISWGHKRCQLCANRKIAIEKRKPPPRCSLCNKVLSARHYIHCRSCAKIKMWADGRYNKRNSNMKKGSHISIKTEFKKGQTPHNWKNGIRKSNGRIYILQKNHPNGDNWGYVQESRLVAEKALERYLKKGECIHHINGNKSDNRNKNLLICSRSYHMWLHMKMSQLYMKEHFA